MYIIPQYVLPARIIMKGCVSLNRCVYAVAEDFVQIHISLEVIYLAVVRRRTSSA